MEWMQVMGYWILLFLLQSSTDVFVSERENAPR
jgi:hypothetical protein